jgi:toxin HigB-1
LDYGANRANRSALNTTRLRIAKRVRQNEVVWDNPLNYNALIALDNCHVTIYCISMIKTFANKETQRLFVTGKSKRIPSDLLRRAIRRLEFIHFANGINDLLVPPSNRLHALKGDRKGQHSISINDQWRICFRFIEGDAYDVEITDYH